MAWSNFSFSPLQSSLQPLSCPETESCTISLGWPLTHYVVQAGLNLLPLSCLNRLSSGTILSSVLAPPKKPAFTYARKYSWPSGPASASSHLCVQELCACLGHFSSSSSLCGYIHILPSFCYFINSVTEFVPCSILYSMVHHILTENLPPGLCIRGAYVCGFNQLWL